MIYSYDAFAARLWGPMFEEENTLMRHSAIVGIVFSSDSEKAAAISNVLLNEKTGLAPTIKNLMKGQVQSIAEYRQQILIEVLRKANCQIGQSTGYLTSKNGTVAGTPFDPDLSNEVGYELEYFIETQISCNKLLNIEKLIDEDVSINSIVESSDLDISYGIAESTGTLISNADFDLNDPAAIQKLWDVMTRLLNVSSTKLAHNVAWAGKSRNCNKFILFPNKFPTGSYVIQVFITPPGNGVWYDPTSHTSLKLIAINTGFVASTCQVNRTY